MRFKAMLLACLLAAAPVAAQSRNETVPPEQLAREAVELMLQALRGVIANLPQYAPPEIDQDGNITIRRLNPKRLARPDPAPVPDDGLKL